MGSVHLGTIGWPWWCAAVAALCGGDRLAAAPPASASASSGITPSRMVAIVDRHFRGQRDYEEGDLIHREDVARVLAALRKAGWSPAKAKAIEGAALPQNDFLVELFSRKTGRRFMRKVKSYKLIYDRLDRIARVPGGQRMLTDLVRLPDGERYAAWRPHRGTPNLLDLLPKRGNSRTRSIKDYERPTGKIYTAAQLKKVLADALHGGKAASR